ncbi:probable YCF1-Vacuolar ABC transporter responsible for vacuolar sequestration of glutathione-S-conjugates [Sporisorium reilianum SRZ2]|uniref:Probable YCF1-Vacuolar ABC transporter responsible for vacuolar sequestration of glutathione-S-conjugates n=1 Tax=Sporisorium reilianum (strain SRZ2) TaxID=999809 RepID=E7A0D9_SPORE|nr:probable YCF1-Vacuolar ABC transporter responsible for vacuolar sequestration of glutathione-S-conjugates [Sporisorium reilianum SRZ2]
MDGSAPVQELGALSSFDASLQSHGVGADPLLSLPLRFFSSTLDTLQRRPALAKLCDNKEGWGPVSQQRDLDFTPCFQEAAFWIAPLFLLALLGGIQLALLSRQEQRPLTRTSRTLLWAKHVVVAALAVAAGFQAALSYGLFARPGESLHFWSSIVGVLSYLLVLALQHFNHTRSRRSSDVLLLFWLVHLLAGVVKLRSSLTPPSLPVKHQLITFVPLVVRFALGIVAFALECAGVEVGSQDDQDHKRASTAANSHANGNGYHAVSTDANGSSFSVFSDTDAEANPATSNDVVDSGKECPVVTANLFSRVTFHWMQPLMTLGAKKFVTEDDMWALPENEDAENLGRRFDKFWTQTKDKATGKPAFWTTLAYAYGGPFLFAAILKMAQDMLAFVQPQILRKLLQFVQSYDSADANQSAMQGYLLSAALFAVAVTQTSFLHQYFQLVFVTGMRVRAGLVSAIFKKSLRLSNEDRGGRATGDIVNLMSVDATRLQDLCTYGHIAWSALFQMTLAFVSLYNLLGWPSFVGVAIMVVSVPLNTALARYLRRLSEKQMKVKDKRTRLMNEILTNIKSIKLFAWEEAFTRKLFKVRNDEELKLLRTVGVVSAFFNFFWTAIPFFVSLGTFVTYAYTNPEPLTADVIFPALALYQLLSFPIAMFAGIISALLQAQVSAGRLSDFFDAGELDPTARKVILPGQREPVNPDAPSRPDNVLDTLNDSDNPAHEPEQDDEVVVIRDGEFKWSRSQPVPTLQDINLSVKKGELLAVLGKVGDGKSSLLSAVLGEMVRTDGEAIVKGRTAYFTQGGWCMGATVRDNILFGLKYEPEFYQRVIDACALTPDLNILPEGDRTEVGERGVSLSGGQRARIALARACYARADIYLLDDPLAAVDAHVGAHIFKHVIGPEGLLRSKARILTLNSVACLPQCDQIVSVRRGIILDERGTYDEVMAKKGDLFNLITGLGKQSAREQAADDGAETPTKKLEVVDMDKELDMHGQGGEEGLKGSKLHRRISSASMVRPKTMSKRQIKQDTIRQLKESSAPKEKSEQGSVKPEVYRQYIKSCSVLGVVLYILAQILSQVMTVSRDVVLKQWGKANEKGGDDGSTRFYLTLYGIVGILASICICIAPFILWTWLVISSARRFHDKMFDAVLRSPLQWFETTPTGRLLNLFSRDVNVIDEVLPRVIHGLIRTMTVVLGVLCVVAYSVPPFLIAIIPLAFAYRAVLRYYLATSRELKRLDSVSKTPIFTWFQESLGGLSSIRAFGQESRFIATSEAHVDRNQQCYFPAVSCNRWLAVRIEMMGSVIIFVASTLAVLIRTRNGKMDAGLLGLMMSQALSTTQTLNWVVRSASEVEQNIVSVERVMSYTDLVSEAAYEVPEQAPPSEWPSKGEVSMQSYSTRYRRELGLVLKKLNLDIQAGERIGVVGRTGAGKSSLTLALFRIIEAAEGKIVIDGIDVSKIGLKDLRSAIAIIPQDPQLWEGTLRENLDPTGRSDDAALWKALEQARMKEHVQSLDGTLDAQLTEGGTNLSAGQRQLICIARAFLRNAKILVLDEATSAIDLETDAQVQAIVRSEFQGTTITVAHRLNTVIDSTRVLVLKDGAVAEFDTPDKLLADKQSIFFSMALEAGLAKLES